jgi:ParB family transcriptional regulator, chromosome partitioning protein
MTATKMLPTKNIQIKAGNREKLDSIELQELEASIKEHGMLAPIIVAPHPKKKGVFRLIAGERRLRVALALEQKEIEAKLFADLTEAQMVELQLVENLQRVNLSAWEEAHQVDELAKASPAARLEDLALKIGRSPRWVAVRLALGKLDPELRKLVVEQDWPLSHLPLLARVPIEIQPKVLEKILEFQQNDWTGDWSEKPVGGKAVPVPPPMRELEHFLGELQSLLVTAPWDLDDAKLLPQAGACTECPKRSAAQVLLFPDQAKAKDDQCLDVGCWKAKQAALVALNVHKLTEKEKGKIPVLLEDYRGMDEETRSTLGPVTTEKMQAYDDCKKTDPQAMPAVVVSGEKAGTVKYVKPRAGGSNRNGKAKRPIDQETGRPEQPSTKERMAALRLKRQCRAAELWSERLEKIQPKFPGMLDRLLVIFGTMEKREHRNPGEYEDLAKAKKENWPLEEGAWEQLRPVFQSRLHKWGPETQGEDIWQEAIGQASALLRTEDLRACWNDTVGEIPLTKTLAKEKVDDEKEMPT